MVKECIHLQAKLVNPVLESKMKKPGYVSLDKSGVNKEAGSKSAMPGFEGFSAYESNNEGYNQDEIPPDQQQNNPDVRKAQPSISVPDRYYILLVCICGTCISSLIC